MGIFDYVGVKRYDTRLMLPNKLPRTIYPINLCRNAPTGGNRLVGEIFISELKALSPEFKSQPHETVSVDLTFSLDKEGYCCITGEITTRLALICQRCLQPMVFELKSEVLVSPIASDEEAKQLPERYEPLLVLEGEVTLAEWIAEELHLALPLVPRHDDPCTDDAARV